MLWLQENFQLCVISIILHQCIFFLLWWIYISGVATNLFPFRPWPILAIKLLTIIMCFHVYYLFMYIITPWPFQHMFVKFLMHLENIISSNSFQACIFHPFQHFWKYYNYYPKALDIWNIGWLMDDKMHCFILFCYQSFTSCYSR